MTLFCGMLVCMIAYEIRSADDNDLVLGWIDSREDGRHLASVTIPVWTNDGLGALILPFKTIEPNRCLIADPEDLPLIQRLRAFRPYR